MTIDDFSGLGFWLWYGLLGVSVNCGSTSESLLEDTSYANKQGTVEIRCLVTPRDRLSGEIHYEITNHQRDPIYIVDSSRMPYQITDREDMLVILHGINPPDPDIMYHIIETPTTRRLSPGEGFRGQTIWPMREMHDHYGGHVTPKNLLHGTIRVRCEAGWWSSAITEADRSRIPFAQVLASQHIVSHSPIEINIPLSE